MTLSWSSRSRITRPCRSQWRPQTDDARGSRRAWDRTQPWLCGEVARGSPEAPRREIYALLVSRIRLGRTRPNRRPSLLREIDEQFNAWNRYRGRRRGPELPCPLRQLRRAVGHGLASGLRAVRGDSYQVTDGAFARPRGPGLSEDELFELTIAAAIGAAERGL